MVLAQYLIASGDAGILDERVTFFDRRGPEAGEAATVWQHVQRALALVEKRVIPGTALAAYGHGDWNDSLQPADPALRDQHVQRLDRDVAVPDADQLWHGRCARSGAHRMPLASNSGRQAVQRDFQRLLLVDGVLAGYAIFEGDGGVRYLLHPRDDTTGVRYSSLAMIHAILEDMLTPAQARDHLRLIETHLSAADGVRLFDRPMPYHGGPQRMFQRAESATFFGREIGLMYMHAHLRYAQALAHVGRSGALLPRPVPGQSDRHPLDRADARRCARQTATTPAPMRRSTIAIRRARSTSASRAARSRSMAAGACTRAVRA